MLPHLIARFGTHEGAPRCARDNPVTRARLSLRNVDTKHPNGAWVQSTPTGRKLRSRKTGPCRQVFICPRRNGNQARPAHRSGNSDVAGPGDNIRLKAPLVDPDCGSALLRDRVSRTGMSGRTRQVGPDSGAFTLFGRRAKKAWVPGVAKTNTRSTPRSGFMHRSGNKSSCLGPEKPSLTLRARKDAEARACNKGHAPRD